jgi:Zn-dependent peptidase ImmA (M78 family)
MPFAACMKDLYDRLKDVGFDAKFVRDRVLPDWWEDPLAEVPASRAMAEMAISRMLGFPIAQLHDPAATLTLPAVSSVRLKRNQGVEARDLMPSVLLAERTAQATLAELAALPAFAGGTPAEEARQAILADHRCVDLKSLLEFAWQRGIVVLHLAALPKSKKFSGMAMFSGKTPVVVLAHGSDSPAWLAFHLAHELGHIYLGHVAAGSTPLADSNIDQLDQDHDEKAADAFACTLLTGRPAVDFKAIYGLTAEKLVARARETAAKYQIEPGTIALIYGKAERMPVAQNALKLLGCDHGARRLIADALQQHLRRADDLPETAEQFLSLVSAT